MTPAMFQALKTLVSDVESSIYQSGNYSGKIDAKSFADWYLVHELTYNGEPNHPKSCYFYFRNKLMYAGPVWDFDWFTFQCNTSGLFIPESISFDRLLRDPSFLALVKTRWETLKPQFQSIGSYIDAQAASIRSSESLNWVMWPCTSYNVNGDVTLSFDQAVSRMKQAVNQRIQAIDTALSKR